jgi:hypothetical protein
MGATPTAEYPFWNELASVRGVSTSAQPTADQRADIKRVGDIEVEAGPHGYAVTIRLTAAAPDLEWSKLFRTMSGATLVPPARGGTIRDATIEILVRNEEQMSASVKHAEQALADANRAYNDEVLPRRERHRRLRDDAGGHDQDGLDAMARAANAL